MPRPTQRLKLADQLQAIEAGQALPGTAENRFLVALQDYVKSGELRRIALPQIGLGVVYNLTFASNSEVLVESDCDLLNITLRKRGGYLSGTKADAMNYLEGAELEVHAMRAGVPNAALIKADSEIQMVVIHLRPEALRHALPIDPRQLPQALANFILGHTRDDHVELRYTLPERVGRALDCIMETDIGEALRDRYFQAKLMECLLDVIDLLRRPQALAQRDGFVGKNLRPFDRARTLLLQEYRQPPSLDDLARRVGVSRRKLTDGFRRQYGISPMAFVLKLRMEKARRLLRSGEFQIAQVAHRVGYQQAANFSQAYKAHFGHSPRHDL